MLAAFYKKQKVNLFFYHYQVLQLLTFLEKIRYDLIRRAPSA